MTISIDEFNQQLEKAEGLARAFDDAFTLKDTHGLELVVQGAQTLGYTAKAVFRDNIETRLVGTFDRLEELYKQEKAQNDTPRT
jgi:hypothetical protein